MRKIESGNPGVGFGNVAQVLRALGVLDLVVTAADPLERDIGRLWTRASGIALHETKMMTASIGPGLGPATEFLATTMVRPIEPRICTMLRIG